DIGTDDEYYPSGMPDFDGDSGATDHQSDGATAHESDGSTGHETDGATGHLSDGSTDNGPTIVYDGDDGFIPSNNNDFGGFLGDPISWSDDDPLPIEFPPIAEARGPYYGEVGEFITFDGSASFDPDGGALIEYSWDLGDGISSYLIYPRRTYDEPGTYYVELTVTDNEGRSDTDSAYVVITEDEDDYDDEVTVLDGVLAVKARILGDDHLRAGETAILLTHVENIGDEDLEDFKVTAVVQELAIRAVVGPFDLDDGDEESKHLYLEIPGNVSPGNYDIRITYSNDNARRVIYREFTIV
ncbi:MAG: PKD domain-containing protein, partial [Candidatus Woesearchaeota archaeon]